MRERRGGEWEEKGRGVKGEGRRKKEKEGR
jgi:hypothetical protein